MRLVKTSRSSLARPATQVSGSASTCMSTATPAAWASFCHRGRVNSTASRSTPGSSTASAMLPWATCPNWRRRRPVSRPSCAARSITASEVSRSSDDSSPASIRRREQLGAAEDGAEHVVEVVRHAGGHLAGDPQHLGLHEVVVGALQLLEGLLEAALQAAGAQGGGQVARQRQHQVLLRGREGRRVVRGREQHGGRGIGQVERDEQDRAEAVGRHLRALAQPAVGVEAQRRVLERGQPPHEAVRHRPAPDQSAPGGRRVEVGEGRRLAVVGGDRQRDGARARHPLQLPRHEGEEPPRLLGVAGAGGDREHGRRGGAEGLGLVLGGATGRVQGARHGVHGDGEVAQFVGAAHRQAAVELAGGDLARQVPRLAQRPQDDAHEEGDGEEAEDHGHEQQDQAELRRVLHRLLRAHGRERQPHPAHARAGRGERPDGALPVEGSRRGRVHAVGKAQDGCGHVQHGARRGAPVLHGHVVVLRVAYGRAQLGPQRAVEVPLREHRAARGVDGRAEDVGLDDGAVQPQVQLGDVARGERRQRALGHEPGDGAGPGLELPVLAVPGHRDEEGFEAEARQAHAGDEQHGHPAPQTARVWRQAAGESGEGQSHRHVPASCRSATAGRAVARRAVRDAIARRATRSSARVTTLSRDSVDLRVVAALAAHGPCGGGVIGCAPRADEVRVGPQGAGGRVRGRSGRRSLTAPEPLVVWVGLPCRGAPAGPEGPEPRRTVPSHPPILRPYRAGARDSVRLGPCAPGTGTIPWVERNGPFAPTSGSRLSNPATFSVSPGVSARTATSGIIP